MKILKHNLSALLFIMMTALMVVPLLSSCGKQGNINPVEAKIEYQVLNLSYDILPVNLYINFLKQNTSPFSYPNASGYFGLNTIDTPFQIRSASIATVINFLKIDSVKLQRRTKYSLYITGSRKEDNIAYIFTTDTSPTPKIGRGKVRFVNAALPVEGTTTGLVFTANETPVLKKALKYKEVSDYIEMSAGNYNFRVSALAKPGIILKELPRTAIADGRLYTIYTYGIAQRTDTAAFGAAILTNR